MGNCPPLVVVPFVTCGLPAGEAGCPLAPLAIASGLGEGLGFGETVGDGEGDAPGAGLAPSEGEGVGLGEAPPGIVISEVGREISEPFSSITTTVSSGACCDLDQRYQPPPKTTSKTSAPMIKGPKSRQIARDKAEYLSRSKDVLFSVTVSSRTGSSIHYFFRGKEQELGL